MRKRYWYVFLATFVFGLVMDVLLLTKYEADVWDVVGIVSKVLLIIVAVMELRKPRR